MAKARRRSAARVNVFDTPAPKGKNPGPIPKSTRFVAKDVGAAVADDESRAFSGMRLGEEMPRDRRNRAVSDAALSPALARMRGAIPDNTTIADDGDDDDQREDDGAEQEQESTGLDLDEATLQQFLQQAYDKGVRDTEQRLVLPSSANKKRMAAAAAPPRVAQPRSVWEDESVQQPKQPAPAPHPSQAFMPAQTSAVLQPRSELPPGTFKHDATGLMIRMPTVADIDRLWDWIRADADKGQTFLGRQLSSSIELHTLVNAIHQAEGRGLALIRAVAYQAEHFGFAMLAPILADEKTALMHIYLAQPLRGQLHTLVGPLVELAAVVQPSTTFAVYSADATWATLHRRLLVPLGFTEQVLFTKRPSVPGRGNMR